MAPKTEPLQTMENKYNLNIIFGVKQNKRKQATDRFAGVK